MSYDAFIVRLDPQDDNSYAHIHKFGVQKGTKLLTAVEQVILRELLLSDGQLGKTVGVNGIRGEGYIVLNTFPKMDELHSFFRSVAGEEMNGDTLYSMNAKKKADAAAAAAAPKSDKGGFRRRRSLRKSSKRAQRKNSRGTKLR